MANLNEFVQIFENSIDADTCNFLINAFENNTEFTESNLETDTGYIKSELDVTAFRNTSDEVNSVQRLLIQKVYEHRDLYYEIFNQNIFPETHAFEHFKIQKLQANDEDHFYTTVDVKDYSSARRFLGFIWFLNDNNAGQYEFLDLFIQPEAGKVIVYPPFWMFPKKKYIPIKEPQYILTTYLHYK